MHTNEPYNRYNLGPQFFLPGLANSVNFVGFYQNHGFQARVAVNWTATQLVSTTQEQSGGAFGNEPVFVRPFTEVDFSAQYNINDHVSVFLKALNLTNAEVVEHGRFDNQLLNIQDIGQDLYHGSAREVVAADRGRPTISTPRTSTPPSRREIAGRRRLPTPRPRCANWRSDIHD